MRRRRRLVSSMEAEQLAEDGLSGRAVARQRLNRSMDDRSMDQLVAEFQPVDELDDWQKDSVEAIALVEGTARSSYACFLNLGLLGVQATLDDTANIRDLRIYTAGLGGAGLTGRSLQRSLLVNAQTLSSSILDAAYTYTSEVHLPGPQHTPELEEPPQRAQTPAVPIIAVQQETPSTAQKPLQALQQSTLAFNRTKGQSIIGSLSKISSAVSSQHDSCVSTQQQDGWESTQPEDLVEELRSIDAGLADSDGSFFQQP